MRLQFFAMEAGQMKTVAAFTFAFLFGSAAFAECKPPAGERWTYDKTTYSLMVQGKKKYSCTSKIIDRDSGKELPFSMYAHDEVYTCGPYKLVKEEPGARNLSHMDINEYLRRQRFSEFIDREGASFFFGISPQEKDKSEQCNGSKKLDLERTSLELNEGVSMLFELVRAYRLEPIPQPSL